MSVLVRVTVTVGLATLLACCTQHMISSSSQEAAAVTVTQASQLIQLEMGAGASSIASNVPGGAPSSGTSLLSRISVSSVALTSRHARRIQELESQVLDLKARLCIETDSADACTVPHASFQYPVEFNFSDESIDIRAPVLPPLDRSRLSVEQAAVAELLQKEYRGAESGAQDLMRILKKQIIRTMRSCWAQWHQFPLLASDSKMTSTSVPLTRHAVNTNSMGGAASHSIDCTPSSAEEQVKQLQNQLNISNKRNADVCNENDQLRSSVSELETLLRAALEDAAACRAQLGIGNQKIAHLPKQLESSSALARDITLMQKLSDAAVSSFKRQERAFMEGVFTRHAEPVGLSSQDLASALKVSEADAVKLLQQIDVNKKGHANFEEFSLAIEILLSDHGEDHHDSEKIENAWDVFLQCAKVKGLSTKALIAALKEIDAPVLLSREGCSPEQIFFRIDADTSGWVDFEE